MAFGHSHWTALTGDLVGSTSAGPDKVATSFRVLAGCGAEIGRWPQDRGGPNSRPWSEFSSCFTRFRGDGWQMLVPGPELALRAVLHIIASLAASGRALPTRIGIGIGGIESIGGTDLSDASGTALVASGQALDRLRRSERLSIAGEGVQDLHRAVIALADDRSRRWSAEQAAALALALPPPGAPLAGMASALGITPQAVSQRLASAGYPAISTAIGHWEEGAFPPAPPDQRPSPPGGRAHA